MISDPSADDRHKSERQYPHRLRRQLLQFLGSMWFLMLVLIAVTVGYFIYRTENDAWRGRQAEAARGAAGTVAAFVQRTSDGLLLTSQLGTDELLAQPETVLDVLHSNPALEEVVLVDVTGRVLAGASQSEPLLSSLFTIGQSRWFVTARAGQNYYGSLQISHQGEPYLIVAVPALDGMVLAARLRMDVLWDVVADIHFGANGNALVVAPDGQLIGHTDRAVVLADTRLDDPAGRFPGPPEWTGVRYAEYPNLAGTPVVAVAAPVPGTDWLVITELPTREAYAATRAAAILLVGTLVLVMALSMWLATRFLQRTIFRPLDALRGGSERIGQGALDHRISVTSRDEMGQLADAFNSMAVRLQDRDAQLAARTSALAGEVAERRRAEESLRRQAQQQELLLQTARRLTVSLDMPEVLARITAGARTMLKADGCAIYLLEADAATLRPVSVVEPPYDAAIMATPLAVDHSFTGQAVKTGQVVIFNDAGTNPLGTTIAGRPDDPDERLLAAPLIVEDSVLGAMSLSRIGVGFDEEDRRLAEALVIYAAIALKNAQSHDALQHEVEERAKAEKALRELTAVLESRVRGRTVDLADANEALASSLREKEVLLREIHHRVKNNLQVISSLLSLQTDRVADPHTLEVLNDSQHRVRSMALIHQKLYQSDNLAQVDFGDYIHDLTASLFHSLKVGTQGIALRLETDAVHLPIDTAVPCGLILNELVSNAFKHAFPGGRSGEVHVALRAGDGGQVQLTVSDTGVGFPPDVDFRQTESLGLQLVTLLVEQLQGTLEMTSAGGTQFTITFPLPAETNTLV